MATVYLGGAFTQFTPAEVEAKQHQLESLLGAGCRCLKPRHSDAYPPELGNLRDQVLTQRDWWQVQQADLLILDCSGAQKISAGVMVEIGWASARQKPVILVAEAGNPNLTNMARSLVTFVAADRPQAAAVARSILG